ncbi:MAG: fimbrillin family protein [Bacteroidales bacterium]|nr:fimbrillin family protein [Bacteroidales bacterium]
MVMMEKLEGIFTKMNTGYTKKETMDKMMKFTGALIGVTALLVSCQKTEMVPGSQKMLTMEVIADSDVETKTAMDSDGKVIWNLDGETLAVFQAADGEISKAVSNEGVSTDGGKTMTFGVSLAENSGAADFGYYALYPGSAHVDTSHEDLDRIKVNLQTIQNPTDISFGTDADILVSKPIDGLQEQPATLSLQFARVVSVGKMTVRNLASGGNVSRIIFTAPGKAVTGNSEISLVTGKASAYVTVQALTMLYLTIQGRKLLQTA